jgi:hypothetical protein
MSVRAVVHIGPIKTGSTALAAYFTRASGRGLLPPEILYPMGELWFGRVATGAMRQCPEIARLVHNDDGTFRFAIPAVEKAVANVAQTLRDQPGTSDKTAVFIAETVTDNRPPELIQQLFTSNFDEVVFIMVVRRQDKAAASALAQDIKTPHLGRTNLDPRKREPLYGQPFGEFNHLRNYDRWITGEANYSLVVIPYLEGEHGSFSSIERFHRAAGLPMPVELPGIEGQRIHPTFSRDGLEALVQLKKRIRRWGRIPGVTKATQKKITEVTRVYLQAANTNGIEPSGKRFKPYGFTHDEAGWILQQFDASNRELVSRVIDGPFREDWIQWEKALDL